MKSLQTPPGLGPHGQLAHPDAIEHNQVLRPQTYQVGEHAWCIVGNGLSNQTFVRGPLGIIAIDTGESIEEMRDALKKLRQHTDEPIVACIYTHFHYVNGTAALWEQAGGATQHIYGHQGINANRARFGGEIAPRVSRGIVGQFGLALPNEGEDALLHCGLGRFFRNSQHHPFTPGYIAAQHTISEPTRTTIAGLDVVITPAPSDADDSLTIWFESLGLCVNNLVWPSLFNIYAIRGEAYRDPRVLLTGIDEILDYAPDHLIGTHGPPISGASVAPAVTDMRDAIQFIWDQTVRGANSGMSLSDLCQSVQLPQHYQRSYFTRQFYGLVEHHVRQIYNGLFGWFDEADHHLLPLPDKERFTRMIKGFGGRDVVRAQLKQALAEQDWRWALELGSWLTQTDPQSDSQSQEGTPPDRQQLAHALRGIAQHTTSANVRNWCLTRVLDLEDRADLSRFAHHRFSQSEVLSTPPAASVSVLRVLLDPSEVHESVEEVAWHFASGERCGLKIRNSVAIATSGQTASLRIGLSHETWAAILAAKTTLREAEAANLISMQGSRARIERFFTAFDHPGLRF